MQIAMGGGVSPHDKSHGQPPPKKRDARCGQWQPLAAPNQNHDLKATTLRPQIMLLNNIIVNY